MQVPTAVAPILLACFLASAAATAGLVPICQRVAERFGLVAKPKNDRWHRRATPMLGGVAIVLPVLVGRLFLDPKGDLWVLAAVGALISLIGLVDDVLSIKPSTKLIGQIVASAILLFFGYRLRWFDSSSLDMIATMIWLIGITNAFNLLDNMDGLCAGIGIVAGLSLLLSIEGGPQASLDGPYLALTVGSLTGFLLYNIRPASIFMGDCGSLFVGLTLAAVTVSASQPIQTGGSLLSVVLGPVMVLLIPIFDTALVTFSRLWSGRPASRGGKDHSSHRLVAIGLPEGSAVMVLLALAACGGLLSVAFRRLGDSAGVVAVAFLLAVIIFAVYLAKVKVYEESDSALMSTGRITPFLSDIMHKRRIAEVLLDFCLVALAYNWAYRLRFEGSQYNLYYPVFVQSIPLVLGIQMPAMFIVGVYRGVWSLFGLMDAVTLAKAVLFGTLGTVLAVLYIFRFENYSRSVFVIYAALLYIMVSASRASFRLIAEFVRRRMHGDRLVVYGADEAGTSLLQDMFTRRGQRYRLLGYVDDDPALYRTKVRGYPVLGQFDALLELIAARAVDHVVIATGVPELSRLNQLQQACIKQNISLSRLSASFESIHVAS